MEKNFRKSPFIRQFFSVCVFIALFVTSGFAQHLTISTTGDQGTSGTNWSISGNTLNVGASGSATIHPNVITNHLSNVGDLTVNLPWQDATSRNMNINASISYTGGANRTLTLNCANDMVFANASGITSSTASLNVVLRTALGSINSDHGYIQMNGVTIETKGGHFWAGGGPTAATWNGLAVGNASANTWSDDTPGLSVVGSSITTNGGNLYFAGLSWNSSDDDGLNWGVNIERSTISSAAGSIEINGQVNGKFTNGSGTYLNGQTGAVSIGTTSGAITINGYGYDAASSGNSWRHGIISLGTVAIRTVSGNIFLRGEANFASTINDKEGIIFGSGTSVCSQMGNITLRGTNTREADGQYSNAIRFAAVDSANAIRIGFDGTNAYSGNILIEGNSIYQRVNNAGAGSLSIQTTGNLTIQPTGNAFTFMRAGNVGSTTSLTFDDDWNFGTTLGSFTYGKSTNTANLTLSSPRTTSGAMSIYAGNIIAQQNLTTTNANANILLQATGSIEIAASRVLQTNRGNITFRSNSLGTEVTTTSITLNSGSSLLSNGGNITLGGNFTGTEGTGLYATSARSGGSPGILINNATLTAAGGNIKIYGKSNTSYDDGVRLQANITTTGTGTIGIYGDAFGGNNGTQYFGGITFFNEISNIETDQGNITLSGKLTSTQSNSTYGINFYRQDGSAGQTKHIQIISKSGAVQITGDRGATAAGGIGHSSWGNIYIGSPSNNSWLATGNIIFTYSSLAGAGLNGFKVKTKGAVTYQPVGTSFASAQTFPFSANYTVADSASSLTIGKSGNTANITINEAQTISGPIAIDAGELIIGANLTSTIAADIQLKALTHFWTSGARRTISTQGGNITIQADADANGTGQLDLDYLTLNPGTGNNIIRGETFSFTTTSVTDRPYINGTGNFTLESSDAAFGQDVYLVWFALDQDNNGMGALSIGKSTETGSFRINHTTGNNQYNGPVVIRGTNIEIYKNLNVNSLNQDILLKARGYVWLDANDTLQTNGGDIIFWSDSDNSQGSNFSVADYIYMQAGNSLISKGGDIILAGGPDTNNDSIPDGYAYCGVAGVGGINLGPATGTGTAVSLLSNGGDILIRGRTAYTTDIRSGIVSQANVLINAGTGRIDMEGVSSVSNGIEFTWSATPNIAITSSYAGVGPAIRIAGGSTLYDGIRLINANSGNVLIQSSSPTGGGILIEGSQTSAGNTALRLANENSTSNIQLLSGNGDITIRAAPVGFVTQGLGQILSYGNIYLGTRLNATAVQGVTPSVTSSSAPILFSGNNVLFDGLRTTRAGTSSTLSLEPKTNDNSFSAATTLRNLDISTVSAFTVGKAGNTAALTISSALTAAAPMTFHGAAVTIGGALTATNNTINLHATGAVTQTAAITASNLGLHGTGTFTLNNTGNNVSTLAGGESSTRLGSLSFTDASGGLTIGTVGTKSGIYASGTVLVETLAGDLTIAQNISTTNTTSSAIIANAGKSAAIGSLTGGDIKISGSPAITMGTGGIAKLFSGFDLNSTGLTTLVGGESNVRVNADETTTTFAPVLAPNIAHAIYRTATGTGDLTIVSSGGDVEGSTWIFDNGIITTISSPVNIRDSVIQRKLLLGDVAIEANKVTFSANIVNSTANDFKVLSKTHIVNTIATSITSGGGDVLLASNVDNAIDFDSTINGYIQLRNGITINSNGGNITFGGGNNQGSDYALGGSVYPFEGIRVDGTINLNSGGGNITLRGKSYAVSTTAGAWGTGFWNLTTGLINSGTGTVTLDGFSQSWGGTHNSGLYSYGALSVTSTNTSADAIRLIGKATGINGEAWGIEAESALSLIATGDGGGITLSTSQQLANNYDAVFRGETNILAKSGPIQLLGKQDGGVANGRWFISNNFYLGSKASTVVTTSSSNITIQYDLYDFSNLTPRLATSGTVTWRPASNSFGQAVYTSWFSWNQNSQTISGLTIGKVGNAANVYINSAITVAGPLSVYGNYVEVGSAITSTGTGDIFLKGIANSNGSVYIGSVGITKTGGTGTITLQANGRVINSGTIAATGAGVLNVVMWSDFDDDNVGGGSTLNAGGSISTNGGHVWMGGSNSNGGSYTWNGLTVGDGPSTGASGANCNAIDLFGPITTAGGDVLLWASNNGGCGTSGIVSDAARLINSGSGDITLIALQTAGTIQLSSTGTISLVPNGGSYASALTFGGTTASGNFTFNTSHYSGVVINSIANVGGLSIGRYHGMLSSGTPVVLGNSSGVTMSAVISITGPLEIYGSAIVVNANLTTTSTSIGNMTINGTTLSGTGNLTLANGRTASITVTSASTYDGIISGTGSSLTKLGSGLLILTKDHTYSGGTTISAGNLQVGSGGSLSQASSGTINSTSAVVIDSSAKLILAPNEDIIFSRPVSGAGGLEVKGMSGMYLNAFLTTSPQIIATNTSVLEVLHRIKGGTMSGTAVTGDCGAYVKVYSAVDNTATFQFQNYSGSGGIYYTKTVFARLQQSGNNVTISVNNTPYGTGAAYNTPQNTNILGTDMTTGYSVMTLATSASATGYGISKVYMSGKVNFTGALTYLDTTILSNTVTSSTLPTYSFTSKGTQEITDTSSSFPGAAVNNGLIIFKRATPLTISGNMSGTEEILQVGAPITLTGNNTLTGLITIAKDSSLLVGAGGTTGSVTGNIVNYGRLIFNRSDSSAYPGILSGSGSLIKSGQGDLLMTGASTYSGATTINAGKLIFENNTPATASSSFSGAGLLEIRPASASFTSPVTYPIAGFNVSTAIGGLTVGKPGNTANITLAAPVQAAGPVSFYGGDLAINQNIRTTASGADVLFKVTGKINLGASDTITTIAGDVSLWADADTNSTGYVQLLTNSSIVTDGGDINLGGGANISTGYAYGTALETSSEVSGQYISGVHLLSGTALHSNGGNITIRGQNANTTSAGMSFGAGFSGSVINSGTGKIAITGVAIGSGGVNAQAVSNWGKITLRSASTAPDAISVIGDAWNVNNAVSALGINMHALVEATGSGGGITLNGGSGTATGDKISTSFYGDLLAASGPISVIGSNRTGTQNNVGFPATTVIGKKAGTNVTVSSSNVTIEGNVIAATGTVTLDGIGSITVRPNGSSFASPFTWPMTNVSVPGAITGLTLGKANNTANITLAANQSIAGPVTIYGGKININGALTAANSNLNLHALDSVNQTAPITASGLGLHGPGHFSLSHASNNVSTIAGGADTSRLGSLHYVDTLGGLEIGSVNPTGIFSTGPVLIETLDGDINLKEPVSSNSSIDSLTDYSGAIILNAGKNFGILTPTGGGINVSGNGEVSAPNGIIKLYGGNADYSIGLNALVGGEAKVRLYVDENTAAFNPPLTSKGKFALYRDRSLCFADTASITPTVCQNTNLPVITHVTDGATGIGTPLNLPAGVTAQWASNAILISGTPTVAGVYHYTIPLTGVCGPSNPVATGTITVSPINTVSAASYSPTICLNTLMPDIKHQITGATGIASAAGLPTGVTAVWYPDSIVISGTPSDSGTFNYNIILSGGCGSVSATGTIVVNRLNSVSEALASSVTCEGTLLSSFTHTTTGASGIGTVSGLPPGVTAAWASNTITIGGTPSLAGSYHYMIPLTGGCGSVNATGNITVSPSNTVSAPSSTPVLCVNYILPTITHTTTGATGIGLATGLPAGVTPLWSDNTITISGVPTEAGVFNYRIPLTGGCDTLTATGNITVGATNTAGAASATPTVCMQTALTNITHSTVGATGIGTASGLPNGLTATWASNTITISGTPTQTGSFSYSIPLTGGCGLANATGNIMVISINSAGNPSLTNEQCVNNLLTSITHTTSGATGIGMAMGLPGGLNAIWKQDTITISGTPTEQGTFNYTIPLTGGCGNINATGIVTIRPENTVSAPSSSQTLCVKSALTDITHVTTGAIDIVGTATGLPAGVTALWSSNMITISGTPTESGTFNYAISLVGGCGNAKATGTIIVTPENTVSVPSSTGQVCVNKALTDIIHTTTGATGIGIPVGLPSGVTASWASGTITISGTPDTTGDFSYAIPLTGGCDTLYARGIIRVVKSNTVSASSNSPTLCVGTTMSNITHVTSGATGIGISTGLPAGVSAQWTSNLITISGTPTESGIFNYNIPLTGGCDSVKATGTITVTPANTVSPSSTAPTLCINTTLTNITHKTTGATGIGNASGLPEGVIARWQTDSLIISGKPTASGTFNYLISLTGGCDTLFARGTIIVRPKNTVGVASSTPVLCVKTILPEITHTTSGATGIGVPSGLPSGVTATWTSGMITINGKPDTIGIFKYIIPIIGGCDTMNARGTITVELNSTAGVASSLPSVCVNTAMSNITHSTTGATGIGVPSGLPAGVTASWLSDKITISGKPTEIGVFNYTIPLAGGCGNVAAKGTITVKSSPIATISVTDKSGTLNNDGVICKGETAILLVSGGSTYIWSNGETGALLSVTPDATTDYSVTITANDGCTTESRTKITVNENPSPAVTSINPDCPLSQTGSAAASNVANWTYLWSNGSNTASITGLVQGSYKLTVTNENGCKGTVTATLTDVSLPMTIGISKTDVICQGSKTGSVTVNMSGGTLPYSFLWSSNTGGAITNSLSNVAAGSYSVTVTEGSTSKCKVVGTVDIVEPAFGVQAYITIKENSGAKADDGIVCQNEEAELTVNAITFSGATLSTYQWNDVNGNRTSVLKTGTAGLYTVTVTDSKGCKTTVNKALTVTPVNTVSIGSSAPVLCINTQLSDLFHTTQGASGIGEASGLPAGVTAVWASNKITISGIPTQSGIFNYSIPLSGGCDSVFAKGMITVKEENQVSQASHSPIICVSTPLTSITHSTKGVTGIGVVSGLPAGVTAAWSSNILTISGTPSETGVFNYLVPLTGGCGNISAKGIITVTLKNLAGNASSTPTLCVGTKLETITHTTIGATGIGTPVGLPAGVSASWANNTITIMGSPTESGNFNYSIPLTGGCGNISAKGAIYVKKNLNASISIADKSGLVNNDGVICIGESAILTANGGSSFKWQSGETGSVIAVSPKVSTDYAVTVTGSDGCAGIVKTSITVHAKPNPTVIATNADCLMDQGGTAFASSGDGWTYLWSNGMNTSTITGLVQGLYKVTVTDEKGCEETATATITDAGIPLTIDFTKTDIICQGTATGTISLNVTGGTGPYLYNWSSNAGGSTTSSITNLSKNSYFVTVTESGKKKCSAVSVVEIEEPEFGIQTNILVKENSGQLPDDAIICPRDAATFLVNTWVNPGSTISSFRWDDDANSTGNAILASTPGTYTVTVTDSKGCFTTVSKSLAVNSFNTVSVASSTPVICMNTVLSNITHTTTGATGIGVAEGLPAGVVATWSANVITISGIPLEDGQYNYSIPLIGGCGNVNATGKIIVNSVSTVSAASFTPSLCVQTTLPNITHYTTGVTGIGTSAGLPAGVVASWSANVITISGTPSEVGQFNYSIPLIGGCGNMIATGKIIVIPNSTVSAASSTPALCINTTLSNITHSTTGVTGIGIAYGLPTGVTATWSANLITITGTPLEGGQFNYSIPLIGGCGNINATGKIIVNTISTVSGASSAPRLCIQTPLTDITHYTTGATGVGTPTGLPAGVTATWASNVITVSGIPAESGQFNYSIPLTGSCGDIKATGTITVIPANTASAASSSPKLIVNTILNDITHTTTGATGILTVTGLPAGLLPFWSANTITIRGTPSESGVFNYRVALAGGCSEVFATGTITVLRDNKVDSLLCDQFVLDNKEIYKDEPYDGVIILSYRGGNGTLFDGFTISSTGVNGLELSLQPGKLALGSGSVELVATGVPSDTGKAMFNVDFSTKTCVIELPVNVLLPKLSSLDCNNSQLTPDDLGKDVAYTGVLKINYKGGNNGKVGSATLSSTGVTGLTLTGDSLRLNPLGGTLNYTVTGTPTSTGVAGFSITVGDKTCQTLLNVIDNEVKLSSFFTPNGDGKNDRWEIPALVFYPESKVYIFDRTGRLLVEYAGDSPGWDGTIGNIPASSGDYWYVIQVTKDDIRKGNFTLIK